MMWHVVSASVHNVPAALLFCCRKYNAFNLVRPLGLDDLHMTERVAGFHEQGQDKQAPSELTAQQWAFFGVWYLRSACQQQEPMLYVSMCHSFLCLAGVLLAPCVDALWTF